MRQFVSVHGVQVFDDNWYPARHDVHVVESVPH